MATKIKIPKSALRKDNRQWIPSKVPQKVTTRTLSVEVPALLKGKSNERRLARVLACQALYAAELQKDLALDELLLFSWQDVDSRKNKKANDFAIQLVTGTLEKKSAIDKLIIPRLEGWEFARISLVNKAILRLSFYCLLFLADIPPKVVINEAVDLAKLFSDKDDYKFVNAILDRYRKELPAPQAV
jgi:N utilization substance protein B